VLDFVRAHRLTVATVLQGVWALLLHRWSGEQDVVFGVTVSGRDIDLPGAQSMLGLLINTVPSRVRIEEGELVTWLLHLQETHQANMPFAFVPLADVQRTAEIPAATSLFDTLLVVENYPMEASFGLGEKAGLAVDDVRFHDHTSYKLTVIAAASDRIRVRVGFDERYFERAAVEQIARQIRTLLLGVSRADATTPVATLPVLDDDELRTLAMWGEARETYPATETLVELFAAAVRAHPDRRAVSCDGQHLTYRELGSHAQILSDRLRNLGAGPDRLVGLLAERSLDLVVGLLGILTSGAAYLPLDPAAPARRLEFMVSDAKAIALAAHPALAEGLNLDGVPLLALGAGANTDQHDPSEHMTDYAPATVQPDNLAYVIYTSGSTGQPKGVMVTHANVVRLFQATARDYEFSSEDVWTLFHSAAFDFSVWEIWGALLHGGRLVVASDQERRDPAAFLDLLVREDVTVLNQTPSAFREFMATALQDDRRLSLRLIIFGGEALELAALAPWFARYGETTP
jgi:non-ribosomal peptide synthetase component F